MTYGKTLSRWGVVLILACLMATPAIAAPTRLAVTLVNTGAILSAAGEAEIVLAAAESLEVQVTGLIPLTVFLVKVDGHVAGALNTDSLGAAGLKLSTKEAGRSDPLPSSIDLNLAGTVEVVNLFGQIVLNGSVVH